MKVIICLVDRLGIVHSDKHVTFPNKNNESNHMFSR
jgi:hypothetical protein